MTRLSSRLLLALSSATAAVGAVLHAVPFGRALVAIDAANLKPFYANSFKALWLGDSTTLLLVAALFALFAAKPHTATRAVITLVALIPAAVAVLIYSFLGNFFALYILLAITAFGLVASMGFPVTSATRTGVSPSN